MVLHATVAGKAESVHLALFPDTVYEADKELEANWEKLRELRDLVLKALEEARAQKMIGQALDANVVLEIPESWKKLMDKYQDQLTQLFIVSQVTLKEGAELKVEIEKASGEKCERCWNWSEYVGKDAEFPTVCGCASVLKAGK